MPIEMSLFCLRGAITRSKQFGFKILLAPLRGDASLSTTCSYMHRCTQTHTLKHLINVILNQTCVMDAFQGQVGKQRYDLTSSLQILALCFARKGRNGGSVCVDDKKVLKLHWDWPPVVGEQQRSCFFVPWTTLCLHPFNVYAYSLQEVEKLMPPTLILGICYRAAALWNWY